MHRILFSFGLINIYSYGFMLALAFILGIFLAQKRARKAGIAKNKIIDLSLYVLVSGILGARILFVLLDWQYYRYNFIEIFKIWQGGLVFYGGFITALLASIWFAQKNKLSFWKLADIMAPSIALGISLGRIGCFLNGCCYGKISESFGICFPVSSPAFNQQLAEGLITGNAVSSLPVIPTQLYSSLSAFIIFLTLILVEKKQRFDGFLFWFFILLYSFARFIIEYFRYYDYNYILWKGLTISQIISIGLFILSLIFLVKRKYE
jgi:phosphatidylglycerol:prolipoprotein diacylglycerol transferase